MLPTFLLVGLQIPPDDLSAGLLYRLTYHLPVLLAATCLYVVGRGWGFTFPLVGLKVPPDDLTAGLLH